MHDRCVPGGSEAMEVVNSSTTSCDVATSEFSSFNTVEERMGNYCGLAVLYIYSDSLRLFHVIFHGCEGSLLWRELAGVNLFRDRSALGKCEDMPGKLRCA